MLLENTLSDGDLVEIYHDALTFPVGYIEGGYFVGSKGDLDTKKSKYKKTKSELLQMCKKIKIELLEKDIKLQNFIHS